MLIYDDTYHWKGWGGKFQLGSGRCRLRIYDLRQSQEKGLIHIRPLVVVVNDTPGSQGSQGSQIQMSVRSCASHIATSVVKDFNIDKNRMLYIEYYAGKSYGAKKVHHMPERYEAVEFAWHEENAMHPRWRDLNPPLRDTIKHLLKNQT